MWILHQSTLNGNDVWNGSLHRHCLICSESSNTVVLCDKPVDSNGFHRGNESGTPTSTSNQKRIDPKRIEDYEPGNSSVSSANNHNRFEVLTIRIPDLINNNDIHYVNSSLFLTSDLLQKRCIKWQLYAVYVGHRLLLAAANWPKEHVFIRRVNTGPVHF